MDEILKKEIELIKLKIKKQDEISSEFKGCNKKIILDEITYTDCNSYTELCVKCTSKYIELLQIMINLKSVLIKDLKQVVQVDKGATLIDEVKDGK